MANTPSFENISHCAFAGVDNADAWLFYESFEALNQMRSHELVVHLLLDYFERRSDKWNYPTGPLTKVKEPLTREDFGEPGIGPPNPRAPNDEEKAVEAAYEQLRARLTLRQQQVLDLTKQGRTPKEIADELRCSKDDVSAEKSAIRLLLKEDMIRRAFECADKAFFEELEKRQRIKFEQEKQKFERQEKVTEGQVEVFERAKLEFERQHEVIERQKQVFELTKQGRTPEQIAARLSCTKANVLAEKRAIYHLLKEDVIRRISKNVETVSKPGIGQKG